MYRQGQQFHLRDDVVSVSRIYQKYLSPKDLFEKCSEAEIALRKQSSRDASIEVATSKALSRARRMQKKHKPNHRIARPFIASTLKLDAQLEVI